MYITGSCPHPRQLTTVATSHFRRRRQTATLLIWSLSFRWGIGLKFFYLENFHWYCLRPLGEAWRSSILRSLFMPSLGSLSSRLWRLLSFLWPKNPHFHAHTWGEFCLWHTFYPYLRWAFLPCGDIGDRGRITPNPKLTKEGEENNQIVVFVVGVKFIRQSIDYWWSDRQKHCT